MIIVTGGAGFIGSNLVRALNERGETEILVVDNLTDGTKFVNLANCDIADYEDKDVFRENIKNHGLPEGDDRSTSSGCLLGDNRVGWPHDAGSEFLLVTGPSESLPIESGAPDLCVIRIRIWSGTRILRRQGM